MNFTNTRAVVETGFISALVMVFVFLGSSFPLMGPLATVLMPATLLVLGLARCALERTFTGDGAVYDGGVDFTVGGTGHRCVWLHRHFAGSRL